MKKVNIYILATILILQILSSNSFAKEKTFKWMKISGKWENRKSPDSNRYFLIEPKAKTRKWGYSELINYNSIISEKPIERYSRISFSMEITSPVANPVELMTFFSAKNFREFYAFRFSGDMDRLTGVSLIASRVKDPSLSKKAKWNFIIEEKVKRDYLLEYDKKYRLEIRVGRKSISLYINGKKVLSSVSKEHLNSGKFGFSNRNVRIMISDVKVYYGRRVVFEDDFSEDTIKRYGARAERIKK